MPSVEVTLATVASCGCRVDIRRPGTIPARTTVPNGRTFAHRLHEQGCRPRFSGDQLNSGSLQRRQADLSGRQMNRQHLWGQRTLATSGKPQQFHAWKKGEL
jgi:hypothetical protein